MRSFLVVLLMHTFLVWSVWAEFIPRLVPQMDGSKCQDDNCWAATGAWLTRGGTRNGKKPSPTDFRNAVPANSPPCRGGNLDDIAQGLSHLGVKSSMLSDLSKAEFLQHLSKSNSTHLFAVPTDFADWDDHLKCQAGYNGLHMIGAAPGLLDGSKVNIMNPLCKNFTHVPFSFVFDSAVAYYNIYHGTKGVQKVMMLAVPEPPK
jgi:hypothetical protein